ncbi:ATP-grasp domain-containing protein [soil metagenome]
MNVVFVEPAFPDNQRQFVRALAEVGAHVIGVGERPAHHLDEQLKHWLGAYEQVASVVHEPSLFEAVRTIQSRVWVDRLEATVEAHIMPAARVREALSIPGTSVRTAWLCRDKPAMKQALREAGVPCAQSIRADTVDEVREFAARIGYPLILKPLDAAGASGTFKADSDEELEVALRRTGLSSGASIAVEEFIEGHEGFIDTLCIRGEVAHEFVTHYYPNVLESMRTRWISPQMVATNRIDAVGYDEVKAMTRKVIGLFGIGTSATHMEWFYGPKGLKFSEIGCRPPGVGQWDVYNAANEFDLYREWAMGLVHGRSERRPSRRFSCGMIALRPDSDGRIRGYSGLEEINRRFGGCIVTAHLPEPGTPTQPVEAGYMANAWMRVRHPGYDELRKILGTIGETVRVHAH